MHRYLYILAALVLPWGCHDRQANTHSSDAEAVADSVSQVSLLIAGDLMMHMPQLSSGTDGHGGYDYDYVFDNVRSEVSRADIAIANFETTLGSPPYSGYPQFCSPDAYLRAIVNAGFDILTTSNNHCCDTGKPGFGRTIHMMDSLHVQHLGTYADERTRNREYPLIIEQNHIRIALLGFTYGTNGLRVPAPYQVNHIDTTQIATDIAIARWLRSDVIIALPHWGIEYMRTPSADQERLASWLLAHGVDHVVGSHPHVIQPFEVRQDSDGARHLVAYSLGNYVSAQPMPDTDGGSMVLLRLRKQGGRTTLDSCGYTLHWVSRTGSSTHKRYTIIPSGYPDDKLTPTERQKRKAFIQSSRALMSKYNKGIEEYTYQVGPINYRAYL